MDRGRLALVRQVGFIRFDEHIQDASKGKASHVVGARRASCPGRPSSCPGPEPLAAWRTPRTRCAIYARPSAADGGAALDDGRWYATYFRLAMGFDADEGRSSRGCTCTARTSSGGAAAAGGGSCCATSKGSVTELDAQDRRRAVGEVDLGEPVKACVVNVDAWHAERHAGATEAAGRAARRGACSPTTRSSSSRRSCSCASWRRWRTSWRRRRSWTWRAIRARARTCCADARTALANRRNGATYMEAALARHYDFLKDVLRPPPGGPMAQALGAMKEKAAAPLLAAHLLDPADTDDDVKQAAAALAVVAGPTELPALRQFFGMYRATADDDEVAAAVVSVGQALITLDDRSRARRSRRRRRTRRPCPTRATG